MKIDLSDLEAAFTTDSVSGINNYLDRESGKVLVTTDDDEGVIDGFFEEVDAKEDDNDLDAKFEKWLEKYDCPDWQVDGIRNALTIRRDSADRLILVPKQESHDGYQDMVDFAETVTDDHLRELLFVALNGKGAFRRFKDVLLNHPEQRQRFFEFSNQRLRDRVLEWLADEDIEPAL